MNQVNRTKLTQYYKQPKKIILGLLIIAILVNVSIGLLTTLPRLTIFSEAERRNLEKQQELARSIAQPLPNKQDDDAVINIGKRIPDKNNLAETVKTVKDLATKHGLTISNFLTITDTSSPSSDIEELINNNIVMKEEIPSPNIADNNALYREIIFSIDALGSMEQLIALIEEFNKTDRLYAVDTWNVIDDGLAKNLMVNIKVKTYVWNRPIPNMMDNKDKTSNYDEFKRKYPSLADDLDSILQREAQEVVK